MNDMHWAGLVLFSLCAAYVSAANAAAGVALIRSWVSRFTQQANRFRR